ncbi:MAG: DUF952 domain-containing protein [Anaerolineae bacterium]|nr:DUF952 domain-containing protein [Anaerolineae bacterium]
MTRRLIYHIISGVDWKNAQQAGLYRAPSLETEGFIHCSTRNQVLNTAARYYQGASDLLLLHIDMMRLTSEIRFEDTAGHDSLFPHVYGPIALDAVVAAVAFPCRADGLFDWPAEAFTE